MPTRQRTVITISVPPAMAKEYRELAKEKGENSSAFFREIFTCYKQQKLNSDLKDIQQYGAARDKASRLSEKDIERLVFSGR